MIYDITSVLPFAFGGALLAVATGVNFVVQHLSVCQMSLLSGQDGLNVVVVQTQSLQRKHWKSLICPCLRLISSQSADI